jgi:WD40 repeat protein
LAWNADGKTLASGGTGTVALWDAGSGRLLRHGGNAGAAYSVAWSPDDKILVAGVGGASLSVFSLDLGEDVVEVYQLPGNKWISFRPAHLPYQSSLQGDQYMAVRFANQLRPVYPLTCYRDELRTNDLTKALASWPCLKSKNMWR